MTKLSNKMQYYIIKKGCIMCAGPIIGNDTVRYSCKDCNLSYNPDLIKKLKLKKEKYTPPKFKKKEVKKENPYKPKDSGKCWKVV